MRPFTPRGRAPKDTTRINAAINCPEVRLIDQDGEQRGLVPSADAIKIAEEANLDLVEVAGDAKPPVCRIMDYSKFKYDQAKKEKEAKKKQKVIHIKEVKFKPRIDQHDYDYKKNNMQRFLKRGDKVKVTMVFRGRERQNIDAGKVVLERLAEELAPVAAVESPPVKDRNQMFMLLIPKH
ncbi:MAG: translation initiation factor IF-3 [Candidatus Omnitrophota bacterium]|jgi:translation initiation factor IF-3